MNEISLNVRGIAHDLNNQIMILMNAIDHMVILCPGEPDVMRAAKAAEHCALLTHQLLPPPQRDSLLESCSVREIVSEAAMLIRPLLPAFNRLELACPADCRIEAPPAAIQQALVNLCINAVHAMDGPGVIRIESELRGDSVALLIRDTGPGVPRDLRERVFEPLFTTKTAPTSVRGGCGLGLTRVRETVEECGGSVTVEDNFPQGACFRIVLPAFKR
jgi:signal transduction histidine kinase